MVGLLRYDRDRLLRSRIVVIEGAIDDRTATDVIAKLLFLADRGLAEARLLVDSPGGDFVCCMAIIELLDSLACPVATHVHRAQGIAPVIAAHGRPGQRSIAPEAFFSLAPAKPPSRPTLAALLGAHTRLSAKARDDALTHGLSLAPSEAITLGWADRIAPTSIQLAHWTEH